MLEEKFHTGIPLHHATVMSRGGICSTALSSLWDMEAGGITWLTWHINNNVYGAVRYSWAAHTKESGCCSTILSVQDLELMRGVQAGKELLSAQ